MSDTTTMTARRAAEAPPAAPEAWLEEFLAGLDEPEILARRRREAWERYRELPLPTRKSEEWRYTDISKLEPEALRPAVPGVARAGELSDLPAPIQAILERSRERAALHATRNGTQIYHRLDPELEERGVFLGTVSAAARERPELLEKYLYSSEVAAMEEKLWTLHVAALSNGYLLHVPRDVRIEHPVHAFRYVDEEGILLATHSLVVAEEGAEVTCIDEYLSPDLERPSLSVGGVEILGGNNATVRYVSLQRYGRGMKHFAIQHLTAGRDTVLSCFNVALGADVARCDVTSRLEGPGSESEMLALWFGDRDQHIDHHTLQHHAAPHAHSDLLYKGALTDSARSVFRGLIRVDKGAQLTDAYQTNRNLLLSETAKATSLPNLEIAADDVRCSHGATIGQVDEGQLFYLMARGLSREQAERLLVFGFFDEALNRLPAAGVQARVREAIKEKIGL